MAHTPDDSLQFDSTASPATDSYTVGNGGTAIIVGIVTKRGGGTASRAGGAPTYGGEPLEQAGQLRAAAGGEVEQWYMLAPPTGQNLAVSVPNTGSEQIHVHVSSYISATGVSELDTQGGASGISALANQNLTTTGDGDVVAGICYTGHRNVPIANSHTLLFSVDAGRYSHSSQYSLQNNPGLIDISWTQDAADDWAIQTVALKEDPAKSVLLVAATTHAKQTKGQVIAVKEYPATWGSKEGLPRYVKVTVQGAVKTQVNLYLERGRNIFEYSHTTGGGVHTVTVSVPQPIIDNFGGGFKSAAKAYLEDEWNATFTSWTSPNGPGTFTVADTTDLQELKDDLLDKFEEKYGPRYLFSSADVDAAVTGGGEVEITKALALNRATDRYT